MNLPEMFPVVSSTIASVGYNADEQIVFVQFINSTVYIYKGVPEHEFENLKFATSLGSYLHRNYKNIYPYERIA